MHPLKNVSGSNISGKYKFPSNEYIPAAGMLKKNKKKTDK